MDLINAAYDGVAHGRAVAPMIAFAAGVSTAVGPCVAPRFVAVAAMSGARSRMPARLRVVVAAMCGMYATYALMATASGAVAKLSAASPWLYAFCAVAAGCGAAAALRKPRHEDCGRRSGGARFGAAFGVGFLSSSIVSPCCTPIVATIGMLASASGSIAYGSVVLAAFVLGHGSPLLLIALGSERLHSQLARIELRDAVRAVTAGMLLFLSGYYAVLA